jgi:AbrB family looped-hinge helix DNA binding protein
MSNKSNKNGLEELGLCHLQKHATVSTKGQVVIPKQIRQALNIRPQDKLIFSLKNKKIEAVLVPNLNKVRGMLKKPEQEAASVEQMHRSVRTAVSCKYRQENSGKEE